MSESVQARVACEGDLPALSETMALAFYEDPVWGWAFPEPEHRLEQHRAVWGQLLEAGIERGSVWTVGNAEAAALWVPPGEPELTPEREVRVEAMVAQMLGDSAGRTLDTMERFSAAHPEGESHHYLSLLGTHPDHRGKGIGMALLAENLRRIDSEGAPAYLESTNPANHARYEGVGFAPMASFELGEDGPPVAQMWRDPR
jgi:GNAT superfamily N-acetyltransferase